MREGGKNLRFEMRGGVEPHKIQEIHNTLRSWFTLAEMEKQFSGILILVIDEICTNIMDHSNATWIELGLAWFNDGTLITINDNGAEFDPTSNLNHEDILSALDMYEDRHLGLIMVRKICEKFVYFRDPEGINQIVMEVPNKSQPET